MLLRKTLKDTQSLGYFFKVVLNENGAIFFDAKTQHNTATAPGIFYKDDDKGNALAAIITERRIEIRNHRDFSVNRVKQIMETLLNQDDLASIRTFSVSYRDEKWGNGK